MSSAIPPEMSVPIRRALLANQSILNMLPVYNRAPTVFTRVPVPADAPYPLILVNDINKTDRDGIYDQRPYYTHDVVVYGKNDSSEHFRDVEDIAAVIFNIFHRKRDAIYVDGQGWSVTSISCTGPIPAPTADDDVFVGRVVTLTTQLGRALS